MVRQAHHVTLSMSKGRPHPLPTGRQATLPHQGGGEHYYNFHRNLVKYPSWLISMGKSPLPQVAHCLTVLIPLFRSAGVFL